MPSLANPGYQERNTKGIFALFCVGSYLLSVSYGTTFLLAMSLSAHGASEADAGSIMSAAMFSTFIAVIFSGHLTDLFGAPKTIAFGAVLLAAACAGFACFPTFGLSALGFGLLLGLGWGVFYTLGPIIVAMMIEPARRVKYFALLSGCMMSGIGTGPLLGRASEAFGYPLQAAFVMAAMASVIGGVAFVLLGPKIKQRHLISGAVTVCRISPQAGALVMRSKAAFAIVMVGLGGAIFGGLSSFQTSYAHLKQLDYSIFFLGFMAAVITCRLLVAGFIVKRDPYRMAGILTSLIVTSVLMFMFTVETTATYLFAAIVLGVGYGLTYSVINGLAANEAPAGYTAQSLVLFSLAYFVGVFGFPWLAGLIIVSQGMGALLSVILLIALCNWAIALGRLVWRRLPRSQARRFDPV